MKFLYFLFVALTISISSYGQELFVFTEPASNMPARALGLRVTNTFMKESETGNTNYHLLPELMWGVDKNLMLHLEGFISNRNKSLAAEGASVYGKYRFVSKDALHSHFRMAAYGRASINNSDIHQEEIETNGHNSGYEIGTIATQLLHKVALSASASYERAMDNGKENKFPTHHAKDAMNYTFSVGKLMLPKEYKNYRQTNLNLMAEVIAQRLNANGKYFIDIAPSVQFIFNSQTRIDLGYRKELTGNMLRTAPNGFMLRFEHMLFNAL
ncbi:MAG TPA: hypothetical protein VF622_06515 [Segetibacter sp.]|jgi:hypothetical protein